MHDLTDTLRETIKSVLRFTPEKLVKRPEWGEITLEGCQEEINSIFSILRDMTSLPLQFIPRDATQTLIQVLQEIETLFSQIEQFSLKQANPSDAARSYMAQVRSVEQRLVSSLAPWMGFLAYRRGDVEQKAREFEEALGRARQAEIDAAAHAKEVKKQMDELLAAARQAAAEAGVATFTESFRGEADNFSAAAEKWLVAAIAGAVLTLVAACIFWFMAPPGLDHGELLQRLSTKLVILALLFSATLWCGRVYKALRHLETINRHRAVSIQTLQAFVKAASDNQTRDAVLMEAARAVFGPVPTGFVDPTGSGETDVKVVEWVRGLVQKP